MSLRRMSALGQAGYRGFWAAAVSQGHVFEVWISDDDVAGFVLVSFFAFAEERLDRTRVRSVYIVYVCIFTRNKGYLVV